MTGQMNKTAMMNEIVFNKDSNQKWDFECYGNTFNNIDHANERSLPGCYDSNIEYHALNGTMPKMFFNHDISGPPIGIWTHHEADSKGYLMRGKMSNVPRAQELLVQMKEGILDSFSIGFGWDYKSNFNSADECWDVTDYGVIHETSLVNFACNEESELVEINKMLKKDGNQIISVQDLRKILKSTGIMSKRQVDMVTARYNDSPEHLQNKNKTQIKEIMKIIESNLSNLSN